jgi:hypothetical protein
MLLKSADEKSHFVTQLQDILAHPSLARERKPFVEREIRALQSQIETQVQSSKAIDEFLETSEQVVVLHDLRLPCNGRTVTVDHLLINLALEVVVLSTQMYTAGLKISSRGDFEKIVAGRSSPTPNPLDDALRALEAVKEACRGISWPTRLGVQLLPEFRHAAIFHANSSIVRDSPTIYPNIQSVDEFLLEYVRVNASLKQGFMSLARGVSLKNLEQLAGRFVSLHRPIKDDMATRFGLKSGVTRSPGPLRPTRSTPVGAISTVTRSSSIRPAGSSGPAAARVVAPAPVPVSSTPAPNRPSGPRLPESVQPGPSTQSRSTGTTGATRTSLRKPVAPTRSQSQPAQTTKALSRAVAAGALAPRRGTEKRSHGPVVDVLDEGRTTAGPLRVPDQPESFRKDVSLHAELLRPRTEDSPARPATPRQFQSSQKRPGSTSLKAVPLKPAAVPAAATVVVPEPAPEVSSEPAFEAVTAENESPAVAAAYEPAPVEVPVEASAPAASPKPVAAASGALTEKPQGYYCKDCSAPVTPQMAKFCWQNKHRFGGRVYCGSCQETHPIPSFPRKEARPGRTSQW